jgi:myo-inositol 2-dehydrogenase/D-chiro-inositol 1-dehydrogenase
MHYASSAIAPYDHGHDREDAQTVVDATTDAGSVPTRRRAEPIALAIVGAGKIGRHRARLAAQHAAVEFLAIVDIDGEKAERLATEVGADVWSTDTNAVIERDDVNAVIVSTQERAHTEPLLTAMRAGKRTLVEKPLTLTLEDADLVIAEAKATNTDLRVGYSMRYSQRYAVARQQVADKQIGELIGGLARCYDTLAVGEAILGRSPTATPVMDILTYLVDIIGWCHQGRPVEVMARSHGSILRSKGHDVDDLTVAIMTYDDGAVFELGTTYSLPKGYPSQGLSVRIELLGSDGMLHIGEEHTDQVMYSGSGTPNAYVDQVNNLTFLGSRTSGEWVGDTMFGRVGDETRAWLDHLATGRECHLTTAEEARTTLQVTLAIDESAATGAVIKLEDR